MLSLTGKKCLNRGLCSMFDDAKLEVVFERCKKQPFYIFIPLTQAVVKCLYVWWNAASVFACFGKKQVILLVCLKITHTVSPKVVSVGVCITQSRLCCRVQVKTPNSGYGRVWCLSWNGYEPQKAVILPLWQPQILSVGIW